MTFYFFFKNLQFSSISIQHNDARTATYIALTAAEYGACVSNYTEMVEILYNKDGKAIGIKCKDNLSGKVFDVHCKSLVFAGGPFTDHMRKIEDPNCKPAVAAAAGTVSTFIMFMYHACHQINSNRYISLAHCFAKLLLCKGNWNVGYQYF